MINKKIKFYKLLLPLISMVTVITLGIPNSLAISPKDKVIPDSEKRIVVPKEMMARSSSSGTWLQNENGWWWYKHDDGSYTTNGWENINGNWYLFDSEGWMLTDWQNVNGKWYYLASSGEMKTGWLQLGSTWYYLAESGEMQTGWQDIWGVWYYFNSSGEMLTGLQNIDSNLYYFDSSGHMQKGWVTISGTNYFFDESGKNIKESELGRKALILGETNTDAVPIEDVTNMDKALRTMKFGSKSFDRVVSYPNHTKKDVVNKINSEFSNSKDSDVNYLYFTCHGVKEDSALAIGSDNQCMTGEELRDILIDKKGVFVVMIDSCHAGNFINKGTENNLNQFIKGLTTSKEKAGELCNKKFIVLASSSSSESSYKKKFMKNSLATHFWLKGIGYDGETNSVDEMEADVNIDSKVTLNELYNYSTKEVLKLNNIQHVQKYSEFEDFVLFARY